MTDTIEPVPARIDQQQFAQELVETARAEGVELVGPGGLLTGLTKTVLEMAFDAEMSEHLGYDKHEAAGRDGGNSRNCEYVGARCDGRADSSRNWFRALVPELSSGRSQRA